MVAAAYPQEGYMAAGSDRRAEEKGAREGRELLLPAIHGGQPQTRRSPWTPERTGGNPFGVQGL
jgi:hypothetical protein